MSAVLKQPDLRDRGGPAQPLLVVENLTKHFPVRGGLLNRKVATVQAVDDVSFSVRKGETLGIVGESGCGKSTTARLLMRLMQPDSGAVVFDGDQVGGRHGISVNDMRRQMQMVFQDSYSSLNPRMTAPRACSAVSASTLTNTPAATRTNCPAASASGSTSPAPWRWSRDWSSWTKPSPRWTNRSKPRC
jgi:ABC-type oligopeptide transport system ATPase subunit